MGEIELLLHNQEFKTIFQSKADSIDISDFFEEIKNEIKGNILTQFGLSHLYDSYQKGGPVTTLHNAQSHVFANTEDDKRFNKEYNRKNYEGRIEYDDTASGKKIVRLNNTLKKQRKDRFQDETPLKDEYTGKDLNRDGRTHADHICSAASIHKRDDLRLFMSDNERNDMAVSKENIAFTDGSLNQSKSDHDLVDWMNTNQKHQPLDNADRYGVDKKKAIEINKSATNFIEKTAKKSKRNYYAKETSKAAGKQAFLQGKKQVFGAIVYEISDVFFSVTTPILKKWNTFNSMGERIKEFNKSIMEELANIKERLHSLLKKIVASGSNGVISGLISTLIEVLINTFATTAASFGKILCDGIQGVVSAFKVIFSKDPAITKKEKIKKAIEIIGTAIIASAGILLSQVISKQLLATPLAPFAEEIGTLLGLVITGFFTAALIYTVENFGSICMQLKNHFALMKYGVQITSEQIEIEYKNFINKIDDAYKIILVKIENDYLRVKNLQAMVSDFSLLADKQLNNSIIYAEEMGVPSDKILKNKEAIDDYFLG